jgi:hypothetical protein
LSPSLFDGRQLVDLADNEVVVAAMRARSKELLDRSIAATVAGIEIYNKPDFRYREERF